MAWLIDSLTVIGAFLLVLTVLVFVHELGHYLSARRNGVRVQIFSIGFGPELLGWTDRVGTRWKLSLIPVGGYVKMFGDADVSSMPGERVEDMSEAEKAVSFFHKRLMQRAEIVAAGPAANFLFAIVVLSGFFMTVGQPFTPADIGEIVPGSAAEHAGLKPKDTIVAIDGKPIERFEDIQQMVGLDDGEALQLTVRRDGQNLSLSATPTVEEEKDIFGNVHRIGRLGIKRTGTEFVRRDPVSAVWRAVGETWNIASGTLTAAGQMVMGRRTADELGGPIAIAQMSGVVARVGIVDLIRFMALLSVNLGLINLFPIPILDGGHLLFYAAEAIRGRPLGQRAQEYGFRVGLALVLTLMIFVTWNDLVHRTGVIPFLKNLLS
ncbi:MAG TPA: RIP metalloprotease RseP [Caulobacteraceae bacterium]|nr:RIP metalloprotease RseP [Caulobacteraceae bacterium]